MKGIFIMEQNASVITNETEEQPLLTLNYKSKVRDIIDTPDLMAKVLKKKYNKIEKIWLICIVPIVIFLLEEVIRYNLNGKVENSMYLFTYKACIIYLTAFTVLICIMLYQLYNHGKGRVPFIKQKAAMAYIDPVYWSRTKQEKENLYIPLQLCFYETCFIMKKPSTGLLNKKTQEEILSAPLEKSKEFFYKNTIVVENNDYILISQRALIQKSQLSKAELEQLHLIIKNKMKYID
jgi:hypothetical protein